VTQVLGQPPPLGRPNPPLGRRPELGEWVHDVGGQPTGDCARRHDRAAERARGNRPASERRIGARPPVRSEPKRCELVREVHRLDVRDVKRRVTSSS
jgi:hypothetical protein